MSTHAAADAIVWESGSGSVGEMKGLEPHAGSRGTALCLSTGGSISTSCFTLGRTNESVKKPCRVRALSTYPPRWVLSNAPMRAWEERGGGDARLGKEKAKGKGEGLLQGVYAACRYQRQLQKVSAG